MVLHKEMFYKSLVEKICSGLKNICEVSFGPLTGVGRSLKILLSWFLFLALNVSAKPNF